MRFIFLFFCLVIAWNGFSQENTSPTILSELQEKIASSEKGEKLKWMDSLSTYIVREGSFDSDSVAMETIRLALELDSLGIATQNTSYRINYYNNVQGNYKEANAVFLQFLETANKPGNDPLALAKYYLEGGDSFYFLEDYEGSLPYYKLSETAALKAENKRLEGMAKLYRGQSLAFMGEFSTASQTYQDASKIFRQSQDTFNIISAQNSLSILYSQNGFFEEAKLERDEAIALALEIESHGHLISFYYNAATDATKQGMHSQGISNLKKSLEANNNTDHPGVYAPVIYSNLVIAYAKQDSLKQAEQWLQTMEASTNNITGPNRKHYINGLKNIALKKEDHTNAIRYGKEHLDTRRAGGHFEEIMRAEKFLAEAYEAAGNKNKAYEHFKAYSIIQDSISSVQKVKALTYYQALYETEKRDAKIQAQESDIALLDAKNENQNQLILFGGIGLLLVFGSIVLVRSRNAAKRRQQMQEGFSQNLIRAQEEERTRVARELHDSVGQKLMLLTKKTKEKNDPDMEMLADGTLGELRSIARGLHPATMEKLGLSAALESMINEVDANTSIFFTHEIENIDGILSKEASLHVYRIVQEVLNNMVKHSEAKAASVTLGKEGDSIKAVIKDNGKGFDLSEKIYHSSSLGMKTLLERAKIIRSQLSIDSEKEKGTTILLLIPT